jgi:hypothetical protein
MGAFSFSNRRSLMNTKLYISILNKALKMATITPKLREAIIAILKALEDKDLNLIYQLSACKGLICGKMSVATTRTHAFREDDEHNEKVLGNSLYGILDALNHDVAIKIHQIPAGMMVVDSRSRTISEMKNKGTHPIIKRILLEKRNIAKGIY